MSRPGPSPYEAAHDVRACAYWARRAKTARDDNDVAVLWSRVMDRVPVERRKAIEDLLFETGEMLVRARGPYRRQLAGALSQLARDMEASVNAALRGKVP